MKATSLGGIFKVLLLCLLSSSCSSDLNFDQAKDLKLEPAYVANLAYFNLPASQLADNGNAQMVFDEQEFDAFRDKFFRDNLVKAKLDFEIDNTIARAFTIEIILINASNQTLDTILINVPTYSTGTNTIKQQTEIFENQRLALLKQTTKIGFRVRLASGVPLDQNSVGNLKLRSSATVYMLIE
jgi:hypothetical protein